MYSGIFSYSENEEESHATKSIKTRELGVSQQMVSKWRRRSFKQGREGLEDKPRSGKPNKFDHDTRVKIIEIACRKPEEVTHRSTRELARKAGEELSVNISHMTVQRILSSADLKPHQVKMWVNRYEPCIILLQRNRRKE